MLKQYDVVRIINPKSSWYGAFVIVTHVSEWGFSGQLVCPIPPPVNEHGGMVYFPLYLPDTTDGQPTYEYVGHTRDLPPKGEVLLFNVLQGE